MKTAGEQGKDKLLDCVAIGLGDKNKQVTLLNKFIENWYGKLEAADWHGNNDCSLEFEYTDYVGFGAQYAF